MKLLTTLSALALLSACAVHQPDPCDATTPEECSDRSQPMPEEPTDEPEVDEPKKEPDLPHDTVGDPIDLDDEPDRETDPEGWRDWKDAVERQREIDEHTRELEESGAFDRQADDVTRSLQLWMWSMQVGDMI